MYIDVILQLLPLSYDPFVVNYNMKGLEKSVHELINMLVQYEATTHKLGPLALIGEASTSKENGQRVGCWKRKKGEEKVIAATVRALSALVAPMGMGKGKGKARGSQRSKANDVCMYCQENEHWKRECQQLLSNQGMFVIEVNMITNSASWVLDTKYGAHICNDLQVLQRSRRLTKDEMILRLGDGKAVATKVVGSVELASSHHVRVVFNDYFYVPSMIKNIISISILDKEGYSFTINKNIFYIINDVISHLLGTLVNDLCILQ
ncbi:UNVERIFIED_CONTAM: hypothetical protein Slati_4454400 [Sesamum latifolium]|uniref:Retrovirus-related Pol polyprotein from transposon TNT 1-94-like beta-barrel domain-containing protein n=1 Tax=Sesamum latifolium TaxID=2727402 RepID=A0AAW2SRW6_9LAMI